MGYVEPLVMVGLVDSPRILIDDRKCWNKFKLISVDAAGGAEVGSGS